MGWEACQGCCSQEKTAAEPWCVAGQAERHCQPLRHQRGPSSKVAPFGDVREKVPPAVQGAFSEYSTHFILWILTFLEECVSSVLLQLLGSSSRICSHLLKPTDSQGPAVCVLTTPGVHFAFLLVSLFLCPSCVPMPACSTVNHVAVSLQRCGYFFFFLLR